MTAVLDNYAVYYADKLWNLLPAVYRAQDTDQFGSYGPLREIVNRIGAQVANVRRNIDRLWEDQSIETCDDWVIPYIGALLGTNLVSALDPRGQRIDVANTIYYRRRKGTLAILEEIASNITGWDAKVVEFFRRMGRTRHGLDPAIGVSLLGNVTDAAAQLQQAEGLVGPMTHTGIGGFADLRNAYGASTAGTAFDEYFHIADMREPLGSRGWYNIPRLGVFLWRLKSYPVGPVTPVPVLGCPGWYTFDPTGRDVPLFAAGRGSVTFDNWVSPIEAQLPVPISQLLYDANTAAVLAANETAALDPNTTAGSGPPVKLYPACLSVWFAASQILPNQLCIRPERGHFQQAGSPPILDNELTAIYHYGFPSDIGAGPYDRRTRCVDGCDPGAGDYTVRRRRCPCRHWIRSVFWHADPRRLADLCRGRKCRGCAGRADRAGRKPATPVGPACQRMEAYRDAGLEPHTRRPVRQRRRPRAARCLRRGDVELLHARPRHFGAGLRQHERVAARTAVQRRSRRPRPGADAAVDRGDRRDPGRRSLRPRGARNPQRRPCRDCHDQQQHDTGDPDKWRRASSGC